MDLYEAIEFDQRTSVLDAIKSGVDLNAADHQGRLPVIAALKTAEDREDIEMLKLLLDHGAKPEPLIEALRTRFKELQTDLLKKHNNATSSINGFLAALQKIKLGILDDEERAQISKLLVTAQDFAAQSETLRTAVGKLSVSLEKGDRNTAEEAAALLHEIKFFGFQAMFIALEAGVLEHKVTH